MSTETVAKTSNAAEPNISSPDLISPQSKKMKQGRLGFKPLSPKPLTPIQTVSKDCKKRKLSDPDTPLPKQLKSVNPLVPLKTSKPENDNEVSSSSEADLHATSSVSRPGCRNTLERFVSSFRKEDDITSTNEVIDLTDSVPDDLSQPSKEKSEPSVTDSAEPMDVDCNKENESDVILLDKRKIGVNLPDNVSTIIDSVASETFEPKKSLLPCKRKLEEVSVCKSSLDTNKNTENSENKCIALKLDAERTKQCSAVNVEIQTVQCEPAVSDLGRTEKPAPSSGKTFLEVFQEYTSEKPDKQTETTCSSADTKPFNKPSSVQTEHLSDVMTGDTSSEDDDPISPETKQSPTAEESDSSALELSSSVISPQTADDSFKRATSAGSTPRTSKPRSKVSSAKKAEREAQRQKRKEEKERELAEKKRLKEEAKAEKERLRKEEKDKKEKERALKEKEKQEKREQLEKEKVERQQQKEDERKKRQELVEAKQEEKRKKDEEKRLLEEEKRQKEEEKQKEDEERLNKKKKMQDKFQSFFTKSKAGLPARKADTEQSTGRFMPFELKKDMKLAPQNFCCISEQNREELDKLLTSQDSAMLYLGELKSGRWPKSLSRKNQESAECDVLELEHDSELMKKVTYHVKLLQFHTNYRPPYYGTWRKKSTVISPRNPWKTDAGLLDYEVDSDDEWEEEEPGESLSASEGEEEKDGEREDEDEDEDGWMVPHGYLSEDEGCPEDEEVTPEMLKARQTAKLLAWEREQQRQCQPQRAVVAGCFWRSLQRPAPEEACQILAQYKAVLCVDPEQPIPSKFTRTEKTRGEGGMAQDGTDKQGDTPASKGQAKRPVPEEAMPDLVRLVHGNPSGIKRLVEEFRMYWGRKTSQSSGETTKGEAKEDAMDVEEAVGSSEPPAAATHGGNDVDLLETPLKMEEDRDECSISKRQTEIRIAAIAVREKRSLCKKICWYVHDSILQQYGLSHLPVPCEWQYVSTSNRRETAENLNTSGRKTPNSKMLAMAGSPGLQFSPAEHKERAEVKRPSDQLSITFFTKAKDAIMKAKVPEIVVTADNNPSSKPETVDTSVKTEVNQQSGSTPVTSNNKPPVDSCQPNSGASAKTDLCETNKTTVSNPEPEIICLD